MIIGGTRLCGKVDETQAGYVTTQFFHLWLIPLVPLSSAFVSGGSGIKIPVSWRSVLAAYVRAFAVVLALGCAGAAAYLLAFGFFSDLEIYLHGGTAVTQEEMVGAIVRLALLGVGVITGVVVFVVTRVFRKASAARCAELARLTGLPVAPL